MFDRDFWLEILQVILRNPLRSILSGIGVGWGVFMIVITFASTKGLENGISQDFAATAKNSMFLWTQGTSMPYKGLRRGRYFQLENSDVEYLRRSVPELDLVSPRNQLGGYQGSNNVTYKSNTGAFNVYGDTPDYIEIEPIEVWQGRYINDYDIDQERKVCVIGEQVYKNLFGRTKALGEFITIQGINFKVVGVYKSIKKGEDADEDSQSIFIPFSTFQRAFNYGERVGWLSILLNEDLPTEASVDKLLASLKQRKSVHPDDPRAFGYWTMQEEVEQVTTIFSALKIVAFFFGSLALLAGVIGITNIMLVTVKERTREFGVRRSLGATPGNVIGQVMTETLFMTLLFGCLGIVVSVGAVELLNMALDGMGDSGSFRSPSVTWVTTLTILLIMTVMGVLAGLLPAIIAVQVRPVEALRTE